MIFYNSSQKTLTNFKFIKEILLIFYRSKKKKKKKKKDQTKTKTHMKEFISKIKQNVLLISQVQYDSFQKLEEAFK